MARVAIDEDLCQGTGGCVSLAPHVIDLDGLGIAHVVDTAADLPDDLVARLVNTCPSMAISSIEGAG